MRSLFAALALAAALHGTAVAVAGDDIVITLKYLDGKTVALTADADDTIAEVKSKAGKADGVSAEKHRLIFHGVALEDDKTLTAYGITAGDTLFVLFRL